MNMKSKIFGLNAKLALAMLAVGTMFTGCYDSEDGDVNKPYVAPDPVYYVAGTVSDVETGEALDATVSVDGTTVTAVGGNYSIKTTAGDNKTVTVTMEGYQDVTRTINIPTVGNGETYTAVVDVAMTKNPSDLDVDVVLSKTSAKEDKVLTPDDDENIGLDLTADDNSAEFERTFNVVRGYAVQGEISASAELTEYINQYLGENIGVYGNLKYVAETRTISLAPWNCLTSVTWTYDIDTLVYTFTTADETATVTVKGVAGYQFSYDVQLNHNFTHSHGHGHGADGSLNAGGGILTPEM